ncbi:hypothetical protein PLESTM_000938500 [Pleodorina starrii]|nr:hypothetical protein PLESTM_000938500 [Pleodorina starrii]
MANRPNANGSSSYLAKAKAADNMAANSPIIAKKVQGKKQSSLSAFMPKLSLPASYTARSPRRPRGPVEVIEIDSSPETMPVCKAATNLNGINHNIMKRLDAAAPRTVPSTASPKTAKPAATPSNNNTTPAVPVPSPSPWAPKASPNEATPPAAAPSSPPSDNKPTPLSSSPSRDKPNPPSSSPSRNKPISPSSSPSRNKLTPPSSSPSRNKGGPPSSSPFRNKGAPRSPTPSARKASPAALSPRKLTASPLKVSSPSKVQPKAGAKARGTGKKDWDNIEFRRTVDADNQSSGLLKKFYWVVRRESCKYQCSICLEHKMRNTFTDTEGTSVIGPSELGRHTSTQQHKQAEVAAAQKRKGMLATTLNDLSAKAEKESEPVVCNLMRTVFYTAKKNQGAN